MMNKHFMTLLVCLALFSQQAMAAANIDELMQQAKLTIKLILPQSEQTIVGQAFVVTIEVATDRWFAKGSQVESFSLTNVVMQANNIVTINGSERIDGKTWATQSHEITLYPTLSGQYYLPKFKVKVSVNTEHDGIVSGIVSTKESRFTVVLPQALRGIEHFIVSPQVTLDIDGQFDGEKDYAIGAALTQTITITASDLPAMMIPELTLNDVNLDGISVYHKPAKIFEQSNRGTLTASRIESFTYIFEKPGQYSLPEQTIYWWNSESNSLQELLIPASTWTVAAGGLIKNAQGMSSLTDIKLNISTVINLFTLLLSLSLISFGFIKRQLIWVKYKKVSKYEQRQLRGQFVTHIQNKDYLAAEQTLFSYSLLLNKQAELKQLTLTHTLIHALTTKLNQLAFADESTAKASLSFSVSDAKALVKQLECNANDKITKANFSPDKTIKLN